MGCPRSPAAREVYRFQIVEQYRTSGGFGKGQALLHMDIKGLAEIMPLWRAV